MSPTMTAAAQRRWESIQARLPTDFRVVLYEIMPDGGFTFGLFSPRNGWRTFAVNPDGERAYALDY